MKQNTLNFWVDSASLIVLLALVYIGFLIYYVLPPCDSCTGAGCSTKSLSPCDSCPSGVCSIEGKSTKKAEPTLWGLGRHDFGNIHFKLALAVIPLVLIHIILHWSWVCTTIGNLLNLKDNRSSRKNLYGIILLLLIIKLIAGSLYWLKTQIQS